MFSDKEADQLITEARAMADPAYRSPRYERLQEIIDNEIPAVFIAIPYSSTAYRQKCTA